MDKNKKAPLPPVIITVLGGLGEVGKNMFAIEMGNEMYIIDSGIKFAGDNILIEGIIPSMEYLKKNEKKIKGLVITHGHEDHIGSVPHLAANIKLPKIWAGKLAANLIFNKLRERRVRKIPTEIVNNKSIIKSRNFEISFLNVNHSIPDSYALHFKTPQGIIFHTGDFKFDLTPVGTSADITRMERIGRMGVDVLLSDSTNSANPNWSTSEAEVSKNVEEIVKNTKDRIIIASFASNVYRVRELLNIALKTKRKIAIFGWSMDKNITISRNIKYINIPEEQFIETRDISKYKNEEVLVLCTGTQGETNAALSKMSDGRAKREINVGKGDTVIMSSSAIPGNFESVEKLMNRLIKKGVKIIDNKEHPGIHASGHASRDEQKLMFSLIQPRHFVPVHGETYMLAKHIDNGEASGLNKDNTFILQNGGRVQLVNGKVDYAGNVEADDVYVDSSSLRGQSSKVIADRDLMSRNGAISVTVSIDSSQNKILADPAVSSKGSFDVNKNKELVKMIGDDVKKALNNYYNSSKRITFGGIKEIVRETAVDTIHREKKVSPIIVPIILNLK